jgi:hypothetical protein
MKIKVIIQELFYFLTAALVIFFLMELVRPRIVLAYFNLSWLILAWILSGLAVLIWARNDS